MTPAEEIVEDLADDVEDDLPDESAAAPAVEHFRFQATKTQTQRIDQFLSGRMVHLSRNAVQKLIDDGRVQVNGKTTKPSYKLKDGDAVDMQAPPPVVHELVPENIPLDVLYEDDHLLAINKQANLCVHPARGQWTGTLVNGLVYYGQKWSRLNGDWRPGILHRLDKNTSGVMLIAKSDECHWRLARQFENRTISKNYIAICHGVPELLSDVIDMPIGKDKYVREKQAVRKEENGGRQAVTKYVVEETFDRQVTLHKSTFLNDKKLPPPPAKFSFVRLFPKTGRTHQLRVHMAVTGYPMVGDTMYGGRVFDDGKLTFGRQALHAAEIAFTHPITLQRQTITAPPAADFLALLASLRGE